MPVLAKGARGEHFGDEVESCAMNIGPISVESHDGTVIKALEEMDFRVEAVQLWRRGEDVVEFDLVPSYLHP